MHLNPFIPSSIHSCCKIIIIITAFHNNNFYYHSAFTGVEKLNDDCRKIHLYRNPLVGKQMEHVSEYEGASSIKSRIKIHESSAKLPKICTKQPDDEVISGDLVIDEMTAEETRQT